MASTEAPVEAGGGAGSAEANPSSGHVPSAATAGSAADETKSDATPKHVAITTNGSDGEHVVSDPASDGAAAAPKHVSVVGDDDDEDEASFAEVGRALSGSVDYSASKSRRQLGRELSWADVNVTVKGGQKQILHSVAGSIKPAQLTAIMGPSGAGKSTLLNVLAGRLRSGGKTEVNGTIRAGGKVVRPASFRRHIAYVMQEDALLATQTPREAIEFSAVLRLPSATPKAEIKRLVDNMIKALGLQKCADTLIGNIMIPGISGGEKKRTAIGVELISDPEILFLDEPTSGLDSVAAYRVVEILRKLAHSGRTVVTTIHQPSSEVFAQFDNVLLLTEGKLVYNDAVPGMAPYFGEQGFPCPAAYNPSDHVMFVMQKQDAAGVDRLHAAWKARAKEMAAEEGVTEGGAATDADADGSDDGSDADASPVSAVQKPGFWTQFWMLGQREYRNVVRDKGSMAARVGSTVFLMLIVGLVFQDAADWSGTESTYAAVIARVGTHFGGVAQVCIGGMFGLSQPTMIGFPQERPVFLREYATGTFKVLPYFLSKVLVEVPLMLFQSTLIFLCTYWLLGFNAGFFTLTLIVALLGLVASSTALVIGAVSNDVNTAIQLAPLLFVPQLLFAGFFIPVDAIPEWLRWAQYLCSLKYSINLVVLTEFDNAGQLPPDSWATASQADIDLYRDAIYGCHGATLGADGLCTDTSGSVHANALLPRSDIEPGQVGLYLGILAAVLGVFRFMALSALVAKARSV